MLAALLAAGLLLLPHLISSASMGMGDVSCRLLGVTLGWGAIGALMIAFVAVLPFAVVTMVRGGSATRNAPLPFGPFIALGALRVLIGSQMPGVGG